MIYVFEVLEDEHVDMLIGALKKHGINCSDVACTVASSHDASFKANELTDYLKERGANVTTVTPVQRNEYEPASVVHTSVIRSFVQNPEYKYLCYIPALALPNENNWQSKMLLKFQDPTKDSCCKLGAGHRLLGPMIITRGFAESVEFRNLNACSVPWRDRLKYKLNQGMVVDDVPFITKREKKKEPADS